MDTTFPRSWQTLAATTDPSSTATNSTLLPWMAQQWQVAQFAPYFATTAELLAAAIPWLMERGTAASVRRAMSWLGYNGVTIEDIGPWLHIDPGRTVNAQQMPAIAKVVLASIPAHVDFYRVYHGNDLRPIVLDKGPALDAGMLDGYSGVPGSDGVVESFALRAGRTLSVYPVGRPLGARTDVRVSIARYADMPVLDAWRLDNRVLGATSGGIMELAITASNAPSQDGGASAYSSTKAYTCAWAAPAPKCSATHTSIRTAPIPIMPPRRWGGLWGGPWRGHFQHRTTEEP
ncbi:phage tail protein [Acidovorax sp. HDW3]|nr:phage tail protein [Acidovorax sp. HDW3]